MGLKIYRQKRDFAKTPEPAGKIVKKAKKAGRVFVIQKHAASHLHYDFRLELDGTLKSWAVPKGPSLDPSVKRLALHVEDHPIEYGSFEGTIPKGQYGGGTVMLWDKGKWFCEEPNPIKAYHDGKLTFRLDGKKLQGLWILVRIRGDDKTWLLIKVKDEYAKASSKYDITTTEPNSVKSGKTMTEIAEKSRLVWGKKGLEKPKKSKTQKKSKEKKLKSSAVKINLKPSSFPKVVFPELATLVDKPPSGEEWLHEIKFDGYRLLAFKRNNKTTLFTRNNNDWTSKFKNIVEKINTLPIKNAIFDGEVVVLDNKQHSDFQLLQNSIKENKGKPFIYYVFDLIYYDSYDISSLPLLERKNILHKIIRSSAGPVVRYSDHISGSGEKVLKKSCQMGLEGIISKDINSTYQQKRSRSWLKTKCLKRQEFIIGGFTQPQGARKHFGSLLLGTFNKQHELIYNGNVGTGFTDTSLKEIYSALNKNITDTIPFKTRPPASKNVTWVKPNLIAEVEFTEWTTDNILRHPSFKGLRKDKSPREITKEKPLKIKNSSDAKQSKKRKS